MSDLYDKEVDTLLKMGGQKALENQYKNISRRLDAISSENIHLKQVKIGFENKIAKLESEISYLRNTVTQYKEDCVKLEKGLGTRGKINLNDRIKVKLTPLGAEIYYHQYDELNKQIKERGGKQLEPSMPEIDKDGYTKFTLWNFMELYREHIGMCKKNVIEPLYIELCQDEWKMRYNEEPIEKGKE